MRTEQPQLEAEPPDAEPCAHQPWRNRPFESRPQRFRPTSPPRQAVYPTLILVHGQAARRSQSAAEAGVYMWLRSFRGALFEVLDIVFEYSTFMYCNGTGASTCQSYGGGRCPGCALHRTEGPGCPRPADAHRGGGMVPCPVAPAAARPRASLRLSNETARLAPQAFSAAEAAGGPAAAHCSTCKCSRLGQQQSEERMSIRGADGVEPDPPPGG